jgi:pimeloyl-ACP methyl ester carboxylesterase
MSEATRRLSLDGLEIDCDDLGETDGLPIVLLHGFTGHRDDFETVRDRLAEWTRVIVPDLRGHGGARHGGGLEAHTFEALVGDVARVLEALDIPRCHLLGHSMGGMVALRFTLAYPERVASLVLMSTSHDVPTGMDADLLRKAGEIAIAKGMPRLQELSEKRQREGAADDPADRHIERWADRYWPHMRKRYAAMDPDAYMGFGQAMATQSSLVDRLHEIACPTTILVGEDDRPFLPAAEAFEKGVSGAVRFTIPNAGHHPHQENPDAWWNAMEDHWRRVRDLR